jgi:hypothetical protein
VMIIGDFKDIFCESREFKDLTPVFCSVKVIVF